MALKTREMLDEVHMHLEHYGQAKGITPKKQYSLKFGKKIIKAEVIDLNQIQALKNLVENHERSFFITRWWNRLRTDISVAQTLYYYGTAWHCARKLESGSLLTNNFVQSVRNAKKNHSRNETMGRIYRSLHRIISPTKQKRSLLSRLWIIGRWFRPSVPVAPVQAESVNANVQNIQNPNSNNSSGAAIKKNPANPSIIDADVAKRLLDEYIQQMGNDNLCIDELTDLVVYKTIIRRQRTARFYLDPFASAFSREQSSNLMKVILSKINDLLRKHNGRFNNSPLMVTAKYPSLIGRFTAAQIVTELMKNDVLFIDSNVCRNLSDSQWKALSASLMIDPGKYSLKLIVIKGNNFFEDFPYEKWCQLCYTLRFCKLRLKFYDIDLSIMPEAFWHEFCEMIKHFKGESIDLSNCGIEKIPLKYCSLFCSALKEFEGSLNLSKNNLGKWPSSHWMLFNPLLKSFQGRINLSDNFLGKSPANQWKGFCEALKSMSGYLDLSNNSLSDLTAEQWIELFKALKESNIRSINLSGNNFSKMPPVAWRYFCSILKEMNIILDLSNTCLGLVTPVQWSELCEALKVSKMHGISFGDNNFESLDAAQLKELEDALEASKVITDLKDLDSIILNQKSDNYKKFSKESTKHTEFNNELTNIKQLYDKLVLNLKKKLSMANVNNNVNAEIESVITKISDARKLIMKLCHPDKNPGFRYQSEENFKRFRAFDDWYADLTDIMRNIDRAEIPRSDLEFTLFRLESKYPQLNTADTKHSTEIQIKLDEIAENRMKQFIDERRTRQKERAAQRQNKNSTANSNVSTTAVVQIGLFATPSEKMIDDKKSAEQNTAASVESVKYR